MNTTKCTREEVIQEISEHFSRTGQDYLLTADETVTDAVIISEHKRLKAAGEADAAEVRGITEAAWGEIFSEAARHDALTKT